MFHAFLSFGGTGGELVITACLVAGLVTFGAAFLPGGGPLYRVGCLVLGAVMAVWAAKVLLVGGTVIINALVLVAPAALVARGVVGVVRTLLARPAAAAPALRPHPAAARQFGAYQPQPPYAVAPVRAEYPAAPATWMDPAPMAPARPRHRAS